MTTKTSLPSLRSPLKWAGGKYRVLPHIQKHLPKGKRLIEPFVGSAVVFLNTDYEQYLLNDINADLINFYQAIQMQGAEFITYAKKFFKAKYNFPEQFYKLREKFNSLSEGEEKSALFLYLNRHAYNGLCRYNKSGGFNAPFGRYVTPYFPEKELLVLQEKSTRAVFTCQSFEETMRQAKKNDVIYCDPPYVPLSSTSYFTQYSGQTFIEADQLSLAEIAHELMNKKIPVLISNHNTKFTRKLYDPAKLIKFKVRRFISCNGEKRNFADELLASYTPA